MTRSNQIIFLDGKEAALKKIFSEHFGYLALGYDPEELGFQESTDGDIESKGFLELTEGVNNYQRIELRFLSAERDPDTQKVLVKFKADLPTGNITGQRINQMAIVDTANTDAKTTYFSATTFPTFNKTSNSSISFVIGMRL